MEGLNLHIELVLGDTPPAVVATILKDTVLANHRFEWAQIDTLDTGEPVVQFTVHSFFALTALLEDYTENTDPDDRVNQVFELLLGMQAS